MTRGMLAEVSIALQVLIWAMIDDRIQEGSEVDYLQVFDLKTITVSGQRIQKITHIQEQPPFEQTVSLDTGELPISTKVFVIDDETHVTMLLASEY